MKLRLKNIVWPALLVNMLVLVGCSSGGDGGGGGGGGLTYTGNTAPAEITASNAEQIGTSSAEVAAQSIQDGEFSDATPLGVVVSDGASDTVRKQVDDIVKRIRTDLAQNGSASAAGAIYTSDQLNAQASQDLGQTVTWFCGGYIDGPSNMNANSGTITFYDLCFDLSEVGADQVIMNGRVTFAYSESGDNWTETTTYTNFTVTMNGETHTLSGTETCSGNYATGDVSCSELFNDANGNTYKVSDAYYYGDNVNGYYFSATFYHPTFGSVELTTSSGITFCASGLPGSGVISFVGTNGSFGTITFTSCTSYTVTYNDGVNSGSIDGVW
ncbi:MAG: hypothetical protein AMJ55_12180 [Gammaproteobacteria bacterium SG8_15]|nr:MAG: hypothetical protein AMJ55_12180 [Gammaproteobacteria bacterium SG8_15]